MRIFKLAAKIAQAFLLLCQFGCIIVRHQYPHFSGLLHFTRLICSFLTESPESPEEIDAIHASDLTFNSGSFLLAPRMFRNANAICKTTSACAWACHPQTSQRKLLSREHQKPNLRLRLSWEAIRYTAIIVTTIAGHWS